MAAPQEMTEAAESPRKWNYYDFRANWDKVLPLLKSDAVQNALVKPMREWCEDHAYRNDDGTKQTWKRNDPLWTLSRSDYHDYIINEKANDATNACEEYTREFEHLKARRKATRAEAKEQREAARAEAELGSDQDKDDSGSEDDDGSEDYDDDEYNDLFHKHYCRFYDEFSPKDDEPEYYLLCHGKNHVSHAFRVLARRLMPSETILKRTDPDGHVILLIPAQHIVFDFNNFMMDCALFPDSVYDAAVARYATRMR